MRGLTDEQKSYVRQHYNEMTDKDIGERLGVEWEKVRNYRFKHNIKKSKEYISKLQKSNPYLFKEGHIPFNKGKNIKEFYPKESLERMARTQFKKGDIPYDKREIGSIFVRSDGVPYIKYRDGFDNKNTMPYARYVWEKEHGKIPNQHCIIHKDGNPQNCDIDNLELKSKAEMLDKVAYYKYPEDVRKAILAVNKAERELNKLKNK